MTGKTNRDPSTSTKVQTTSMFGFHAKVTATIAKTAQNEDSTIWILEGNKRADALSVFDVLTLECTKGSWITIPQIQECVESVFGE